MEETAVTEGEADSEEEDGEEAETGAVIEAAGVVAEAVVGGAVVDAVDGTGLLVAAVEISPRSTPFATANLLRPSKMSRSAVC